MKAQPGFKEPDIDTKGKAITLAVGGTIVFRMMEIKDLGKSGTLLYCVRFDADKVPKFTAPPVKGDVFPGELQTCDLPVQTEKVIFELQSKGLMGNTFLGEVVIEVSEIMSGYPFDLWYSFKGKGGKVDKKVRGKAHIQILYVAPSAKLAHDEFKYPLHSLINSGRVDLFVKKIEDMGGQVSDENDKGLSPLCYAASVGAAPFVKILIAHQASLSEKDSEGRNPIHLAALNGQEIALKYLLLQKGADADAPEPKRKFTALHLAGDANQGEACTILIQGGANPDSQDDKGNTALTTALMQQNGAPKSVSALVLAGASVYVKNNAGLAPWEVAQRKDLCYSATTRNAFMKACDVIDYREFSIAEKIPQKQRAMGTNLTTDWTTSTQFLLTCKKDIKEVTVLAFSVTRTDECTKQVGFCVVKDLPSVHTVPSFQPEGIGFGGLDPFKFNMEKDCTYTVVVYSMEAELTGDFGICTFTPNGSANPVIKEAKPWKNKVELEDQWSGKTAAGSSTIEGNPTFNLTVKTDKEVEVLVMIHQNTGDVSAIVFDDNRIIPAKFYIGMYIFDESGKEELLKSEQWHNSKDVYIRLNIGGKEGLPTTLRIVPCTRLPGEELPFIISAHSDASVSLKKNKK